MKFLTDARLFNCILIGLYVLAMSRWAYERRWSMAVYFLGATMLNLAVLWEASHK